MPTPTKAINHLVKQAEQLHLRLNMHREDIDEFTHHIEELERRAVVITNLFTEGDLVLGKRLDILETWMKEGPSPMQRFYGLTTRLDVLEQRHEGLVLAVAGLAKHEGSRLDRLAERIEQLEKSPAGLWTDLEENIELAIALQN